MEQNQKWTEKTECSSKHDFHGKKKQPLKLYVKPKEHPQKQIKSTMACHIISLDISCEQ